MTTPEIKRSGRFADREGEGWLNNGLNGAYATYPRRDLPEYATIEALDAARGPLRPVGPMSTEDSNQLALALFQAGRKGVATLLVALNRTAQMLTADGGSTAVFTSGRPGSWEAVDLSQALHLGEDIDDSRVDPEALDTALALILKWITGPVQPELADGLAGILGDAAKQAEHQGGWDAITDDELLGNELIEHWTSAYRQRF
ncbi:hypothetical protein QFZ75_008068 [Streptomyces sp. V3I8]|uniref:hypothetical protein n=1 Tax=Streptomyces sp. V3I8 TaxID=3042279 RepID=UPI00278256D5|nr:hypothetical protein [Streptomyces sp. V3I8]MDQ1041566.1 hypothetical protein [Streptomyces sp. V3I8]